MIVYEVQEYEGFWDTITAPFRWIGHKLSNLAHSIGSYKGPATGPGDIYSSGGVGEIKVVGNTPIASSGSSPTISSILKKDLGSQLKLSTPSFSFSLGSHHKHSLESSFAKFVSTPPQQNPETLGLSKFLRESFAKQNPALAKTIGLPSPRMGSFEKSFYHFVTETPSSGGGVLKVNWEKALGKNLASTLGLSSQPKPSFNVTSFAQVHHPSFWESLKAGLSKVGEAVITASTQALAQGLAYKIQKELGLVPKVRPAPAGGYVVQVVRPQPTPSPAPTTAGYPSASPTRPTYRPTMQTASAFGGMHIDPKLILLGGLILLLLLSRR